MNPLSLAKITLPFREAPQVLLWDTAQDLFKMLRHQVLLVMLPFLRTKSEKSALSRLPP